MTVILNNGVVPTPEGYFCNDADNALLKNAIVNIDRRDLLDTSTETGPRFLKNTKCKENCKGYATGTCLVRDCTGYRRLQDQPDNDRALYDACSRGISELSSDFTKLLPRLSANCRPLVQLKRNVTCFDDVRYAEIEGFTLWNADTDTIIKDKMKSGDSFCYTTSNLNIVAIANACVREVEFRLTGPIRLYKEQEGEAPYTLFGHISDENLNGRVLPVGTYTLRTELDFSDIPDAQLTFTIRNC